MDTRQQLDCSFCTLKERCVGAGVSSFQSPTSAPGKQDRVYFRGEKINNYDSEPGVVLVKSGLLRVLRKLPSGTLVTIDLITTGDMLTYPLLFSLQDTKRIVEALDTSEVCFIPAASFNEWLKHSDSARSRLVKWTGLEFLRREEQICSLSHRSVRERTAEALIYLAERFGSPHGEGLGIPTLLTREDIAALIGTARESVVRQLAEFKDEGCITLDGRQIVVRKVDQLKRIAKVEVSPKVV